ncbi:hypothetical protein AAFF_G00366380 [Aldrovandia affinis]|uniref:Uncharacterized protein n=1 Tax=Aldrovandia affinis TaxID=143900 RepID=A0AAD7WMV7_9TELE|nr:hypothetical protein AAFF_G00366380 [Aldrovandia affinis]
MREKADNLTKYIFPAAFIPHHKMGEELEFDHVDAAHNKSKQETCKREREEEKVERRVSLRCCQGRRETLIDHPTELASAVPVIPESFRPLISLHCSSHQWFDSVEFDVELIAEVRVEDGLSFALLSSITPNVHTRKSGAFFHQLPSLLKHPSPSWTDRLEGHRVDTCWFLPISHSGHMTFLQPHL